MHAIIISIAMEMIISGSGPDQLSVRYRFGSIGMANSEFGELRWNYGDSRAPRRRREAVMT